MKRIDGGGSFPKLVIASVICSLAILNPALAQAQTNKVTVPLPAFVTPACNGEPVFFPDGALITLEHTRTDGSAGTHVKNQLMAIADNGVGTVTGAKYKFYTISNTESDYTNPPGAMTDTESSSSHLTGQTPENNLLLHATAKRTTNNNGVTTVDFVQIDFECPADGPVKFP